MAAAFEISDTLLELGEALGLRRLNLFEIFQGQDASQQGVDIGSAVGNELVEVGKRDLEGRAVFVGLAFATEGLAADGALALPSDPGRRLVLLICLRNFSVMAVCNVTLQARAAFLKYRVSSPL